MSIAISAGFILTTFFLATWVTFSGLLGITTDQTESLRVANELHADRLNTLVSITSTSSSDCVYTATADNRSRDVSFADFSKIDVFARYNVAAGDSVAKRLTYPSEWNVSAISGDNTNPNVWDSGETATIALSLTPKPQGGTKGVVVLAVPGGIVDSAYFNICSSVVYRYWHNDPTPPTGPTESHLVLTMALPHRRYLPCTTTAPTGTTRTG